MNNASWIKQRTEFGYKVLGPIFFDFCHRLHTHFLSFDDRQAVFLFCTRAGLRLQYLYELFLASQGYSKPQNAHKVFWTSRFMTAKGLFERNPHTAFQLIAKEFSHTNVREMLPCLLPAFEFEGVKPDFLNQFEEILMAQPNETLLVKIFSSDSEFGNRLRQHYSQQSHFFEQHIKELMDGASTAVLVDSGWQATTQRLLMEGYPELDWRGLYFGRMGSPHNNNWHFFNVIGLMFESFDYDPKQVETCVHYHHHIIEDLLEPGLSSVEYLMLDIQSNKILPAESCRNFDYRTAEDNEAHYQGVVNYFKTVGSRMKLLEIRSKSREAWQVLNQKICFPSPTDVEILDVRPRSANFGKGEQNTVVLRWASWLANRTVEDRLEHSLWKQGQLALEYPEQHLKKQAKLIELEQPKQLKRERPLFRQAEVPTVAVITRTKNRPVMLKRAAQSLAAQTFQDFIWVVVNDGGDVEEVDYILRQASVDLRKVLVVHNPTSLGMEAASNRGISASKSKYIVIHDDDDTWQPQFLARTVAFLEDPPVRSMRGVIAHAARWSEAIVQDDYVELLDSCPYQEWVMTVSLYEMASMNMFAPISFLFARDIYEEIGGFDESLPVLGDWDFNIRFLLQYDIGVIPEKLANYHHRDYQKSGDYSNSVYGAISKHQMFEAVVRNRGLREMANGGGLPIASILSFGRATYDIRGMLQQLMRLVN